jgi:predicted ArsR family transcriptional regulator
VVASVTDGGLQDAVDSLDTVVVLRDGVRRRVYFFARSAAAPVTRKETAAAVGISRTLAAFHLDKLVEAGLLTRRPLDRGDHRRVGRAPTVYQPSGLEIRVGIPVRHHELLAEVLTDVLATEASTEPVGEAVVRVAAARGRVDGRATRDAVTTAGTDGFSRAVDALADRGYEPARLEEGVVRLRNCVFAPIAARSTELVCALHHAYVAGLLDGMGTAEATAVLAPTPEACCVEVRRRTSRGRADDHRGATPAQ